MSSHPAKRRRLQVFKDDDENRIHWVDTYVVDHIYPEPVVALLDTSNTISRVIEINKPIIEPIIGTSLKPLLRTQCTVMIGNARCYRMTTHDYRLCDHHLLWKRHLIVAKSRIPDTGLGVFAVIPHLLPENIRKLLREGPYDPSTYTPDLKKSDTVVFERGHTIGGQGSAFSGEIISETEYDIRYGETQGEYVLGVNTDVNHDETRARTVLSFCNDGICIGDEYVRRNYIHKTGTHVVWHLLDWKHVINTACNCDDNIQKFATLVAIGNICHGDEILWSYSGSHEPGKNRHGHWVFDGSDVRESYWEEALGSGLLTNNETVSSD